jgi:hypothetical protein
VDIKKRPLKRRPLLSECRTGRRKEKKGRMGGRIDGPMRKWDIERLLDTLQDVAGWMQGGVKRRWILLELHEG